MADLVVQRVVFPKDVRVSSLYYHVIANPSPGHCADPAPTGRRSMVLRRGCRINTNTYFNTFFESYWRRHTRLERLALRMRLVGSGTVVLWRVSREYGPLKISQVDFDGKDVTLNLEVPGPIAHYRETGTLSLELSARSHTATLHRAEWVALDTSAKRVGIVAGYCTFNRETFVLENIRSLTEDPELDSCLSRIVVVDQGTKKVKDHAEYGSLGPAAVSKTSLIEQGNFGGAGGFTRCLMESSRLGDATHCLFLDDDAKIEPESVFRTAAFLALAKTDIAVGGPMLDLLRPLELYEAGGYIIPAILGFAARGQRLPLTSPPHVESLADYEYPDFNAWWFFAFPLSAVDRVGLPLPLFINCDDAEYGRRLRAAGIPTVTLPGVGVWHMPFYLKNRGWTQYYAMRNMLALTGLHLRPSKFTTIRVVCRLVLQALLRLDYFKAWAICQGVEDYLSGPSTLAEDPQKRHQEIMEAHRRLSPEPLPKTECLQPARFPPAPNSRWRRALAFLGALVRQLTHRSPAKDAPANMVIHSTDEQWYVLRKTDVAIVDDPCSNTYFVLKRDRKMFIETLARLGKLGLQFLWNYGRVEKQWRVETAPMTRPEFWRRYLGLDQESPDACPGPDPAVWCPQGDWSEACLAARSS